MKLIRIFSGLALIACACTTRPDVAPYLNPEENIETRVEDALSRLTLEEKVSILHAQSKFSSRGVPRLGIPDIWMSDGPFGVREENMWDLWDSAQQSNDSCTANPNLPCLAASFNREMAALYGQNIGEEALYRGKTVMLGPGVNIFRTPLNGRNFEYMGEDPYLVSAMAVPYIKNVQKYGVASCVKHFALNNQEAFRHSVEIDVDDRTLHEIYLPAFEAAVKDANVWSVMGAYNKYKGQYCCENEYLLNDILKGDWAFDGAVISDWGGATNTPQAVDNGLDLEFGTWTDGLTEGESSAYDRYFLSDPYLEGLREGVYSQEVLDDKVRRVLRLIFRTTMSKRTLYGSLASPEHMQVARKIAQEGIVLLKNENALLPLDLGKVQRILVVGDNATAVHARGGGSMMLKTKYEVTPLQGILNHAGDNVDVKFVQGYIPHQMDQNPEMELARLREEAVAAAANADVVLIFCGHNRMAHQDREGTDKLIYDLPYSQGEMIKAIYEVNKNTVVTLVSGTSMSMPWLDSANSVLYGWYGGSEGGNAIADVIFGDVNPSGKMPFTIAKSLEDYPVHMLGAYDASNPGVVRYSEGLNVGYRGFDNYGIEPLFPFGYGLSYTKFEWSKPELSRSVLKNGKLVVSVDVKNVGDRDGSEVIQLYIHDVEASVKRPAKELKNFEKVFLAPGQKKTIRMEITPEDLKFYDVNTSDWKYENGTYEVLLCTDAKNVQFTLPFVYKGGVEQQLGKTREELDKVRIYIKESWFTTVRENKNDDGTLLGLPYKYTVPSPRSTFQELYYWDTYFTNRGLLEDGLDSLALGNVNNMLYLVERYGFMPNGSRTYFLNRSQPPYLSLMIRSWYDHSKDLVWLAGAYSTLAKEYDFWMTKRITPCGLNHYSSNMASQADVEHFVNTGRNRLSEAYYSRDTSYTMQLRRACHLIAEAESGWDFCPRFDRRCEDFCPVDLNSYLYALETDMAFFAKELSLPAEECIKWENAAEKRKDLMNRLMYKDGFFYDYDYVNGQTSDFKSLACFTTMFCNLATKRQAREIVGKLPLFEHAYGVTADVQADWGIDYQWSYPNLWPAFTFYTVFALDKYGYKSDAERIAGKYMSLVVDSFNETGGIWEKYDVIRGAVGHSKEYETPQMMGWSAGSFVCFDELLKSYR